MSGTEMTFDANQRPIKGAGYVQAVPGKYVNLLITTRRTDQNTLQDGPIQLLIGVNRIEWDDTGKTTAVSGVRPVVETSLGRSVKELLIVSDLERPRVTDGALYLSFNNDQHALRFIVRFGNEGELAKEQTIRVAMQEEQEVAVPPLASGELENKPSVEGKLRAEKLTSIQKWEAMKLHRFEIDAGGKMVDFKSQVAAVAVKSAETPAVIESAIVPKVRIAIEPTSPTQRHVRIVVRPGRDELQKEFKGLDVLETGAATFLLSALRGNETTGVVEFSEDGAGYRDEIECKSNYTCAMHWFDVGSEVSFRGRIQMCGLTVDSDDEYPLAFKMTAAGFVLLYGRGRISSSNSDPILVGRDDSVESWISALQGSNKLAREAAAGALGWLKSLSQNRSFGR